ncbi:MAG: polyprenyl synthetase family protein [Deltaproteobacteria bacterium]|nr:polyprenyl synthetase family protein [Deltaproteobacteria bacterium]
MDLKLYFKEKKALVDEALGGFLPESDELSAGVVKAMRYSLFAGGKRLRPILCIAGAEAVGGDAQSVLPVACAIEMIHTYSLIHDDLPVIDNDDLRRGKPTNHKVFGEAMALLAGDGLLTKAFHLMTHPDPENRVKPGVSLKVIGLIATAAGYEGMVGGQVVDIQSEGKEGDSSIVEFIHTHKTGALIVASVSSGAILGGAEKDQLKALTSYGKDIGLAFQVADDILNVEGSRQEMGKSVGSDARQGKITYPAVFGLERSKEIQKALVDRALETLKSFEERADPLRQIARYIIKRKT